MNRVVVFILGCIVGALAMRFGQVLADKIAPREESEDTIGYLINPYYEDEAAAEEEVPVAKPTRRKPVKATKPVAVEPVPVEPVAVELISLKPVKVTPVSVEPVPVKPVPVEPSLPDIDEELMADSQTWEEPADNEFEVKGRNGYVRLRVGMRKAEVIKKLGRPESTDVYSLGNKVHETFKYEFSGGHYGRRKLILKFTKGKLESVINL